MTQSETPPEPGAICVMDRGYLAFERLYDLHQAAAFFVIRIKSNTDLRRSHKSVHLAGGNHRRSISLPLAS